MLSVAMLLTGIPCSDVRVNADEYTAVSAAQEVKLPDGKVGTVSGSVDIVKDSFKVESGNFKFADPQPETGVKFVYAAGGSVRNRILNYGTEIKSDTLFVLEYEGENGFDLTKLTLEGTKKEKDGWDKDFGFTLKSNDGGIAVYSVSPVNTENIVLYDVRLKADADKLPDGAALTIKNAFFVSDIREAAVVEEPAALAIGEERIAGTIKGKVVAFSEANTDNYKRESGNFKLAETQPEEGVQFVYTTGGKVRNRIKNFTTVSGPAVQISENVVFVLEYESTGNFDFDKLEIQATSTPLMDSDDTSGWDDGFNLSVAVDEAGIAVFSITPGAGKTELYDVRFKGADGVFENGTTLTIKNAYFLTDIEPAGTPAPGPGPEEPEQTEGFEIGATRKVGKIEGKISGIVKADKDGMILESGQKDMQVTVLPENGGVKFERTNDSNIRNRFFVNEKAGVEITEGDKFIVEFDSSADFKLDELHFWPQIVENEGYEDIAELELDGDITDGIAVYNVPATYKDGKIYSIRIKSSGVPRGAYVTFKNVYFLTDVKAASTEIDPNENPVGKDYAVGDLTGKISGYVKLNKSNIFVESGCDLKISDPQPEAGFMLEKAGDVKIRNRFYINEGNGVVVTKNDRFIIDREIFKDLELENIDLQPQITGKDAYEDTPYLTYLDTIDGRAIYKIPESLDGATIYALRGKATGDVVTQGSSIIIKGMYFLTDVVDHSEPAKPACPYEISNNVQGIAVTYYNDIFSRGVAWRTANLAATGSALQIVNKKDVEDISTFWWDTAAVETIPDYFGVSFTNSSKDATVYYCHKAHVENLLDKNEYYYRVGSEESGWSKPGVMKIDSDLDDFTFIHVTDPQATSESEYRQYENVLRAAYKKVNASGSQHVGTFNTGDITNECHDGKVFIDEYNMSQDYDADDLMNTVIIPVAGNHDVTEDIFWSMYDIDFQDYCEDGKHNTHRTGACYSYQVGNVFILGTNSNESGNLDSYPANGEYDSKADYHEQYAWIVSELQRANELRDEGKIKWIIYLTHAGMMSVGYHTMDGGSRCLRENITPLLAEYEVDLVLQGHDHAYTRTVPYYYGKDLNGNQFSGYQSNERETFKGYGEISYDDPYTDAIETESDGGRFWNIEPEGTHYITINYSGTKSLEISKDNAEARYQMPDQCILDGIAISPVNGTECGLKYAKQFFALVRVSGDVMTYDTYCFTGGKADLFDTFTVIKDGEHQPDLDKKAVEFTGVYVEDKEYDGKAARLETDDILAVIPGTEEEEIQFSDYDKIIFSVTGTLADGSVYTSNDRLPKQVGTYTLHVKLGKESAFFKGETLVEFVITEDTGIDDGDEKDYIGGLTAANLPEDEDDPEPISGGGTSPIGGITPHFPIIIPPIVDEEPKPGENPGESGNPEEQVDVGNPETPEGAPTEQVDIDNPETPEGAADAAEEVEGTFFKKDKQFTGKKLTGFDVEVGGENDDAEYPKEIKVKVDSKSIGEAGKDLYLYKVDKSGNKLLETDETKLTVDEDGYVTFTAYEEGEFVLLTKAASKKTVITLAEQITVNKSVKVKAGKTKKNAMGLDLPAELQGAKVEYSSSDKKIVKISKKTGKITAVKKGKAKITVKVTMPDGTVKKYTTTVTVK